METIRKPRNPRVRLGLNPWMSLRAAAKRLGISQVRVSAMALRHQFGEPLFAGNATYIERRRVEALAVQWGRLAPTGTDPK